jgi:hypothetical protein
MTDQKQKEQHGISDKEAEEMRQEIIDMMREEQEESAFAEKWNAEVDHGKA